MIAASRMRVAGICAAALWAGAATAPGGSLTIHTVGGSRTIDIPHAGPGGSLVSPPATPEAAPFRPPAIFSAPLPSGSGARALGFAGAFTAVADDATAASWNPAGLIQLERPEASAVYRFSVEKDEHRSSDTDFRVGEDEFDGCNLNYFSIVFPLYSLWLQRNFVLSLNYQEAYDFTQAFTANVGLRSSETDSGSASASFSETVDIPIEDDVFDVTVTTHLDTDTSSAFRQLLSSELISDVSFRQEGVIAAISPAIAVELTPKVSIGAAFNYYLIDWLSGNTIRSHTIANYAGRSSSRTAIETTRTTGGTYSYDGTVTLPPSGGDPDPIVVDVDGAGKFDTFTDASSSRRDVTVEIEGVFEEINEFRDLCGFNATLGAMVVVNRHLTLGATVDLPWVAKAEQTQITRNRSTTYDLSKTRILNQADGETVAIKDVEFEFPLYWAIGMVWHWLPELYTTLDVSQTRWSDFSFKAEGEPRINPLDGSPHGENPLDDTWAARLGMEYLIVLLRTEIPLRAGAAWEERPAVGSPDDYYHFSLGSGFSLGQGPGKTIVDFVYLYTMARNVTGIVPDQTGLSSDVHEHQGYVSVIKHF